MTAKNASPWVYACATGGIVNTTDNALATAVAGMRNFCSGIQFINTAAVASEIVIKDGASTVLWRGYAPASMTTPTIVPFDPPLPSSANSALNVAMLITATATRVSAQGFIDA